ncbi:MAG: hypothetical protein HRF45_11655 [Fimbriimonadia bacterium]|jgi:hypothetical protein
MSFILSLLATLSLQIAPAPSFDVVRTAVETACVQQLDVNRDGYPEIEYLRRIRNLQGAYSLESQGSGKGTVLVIVESRLLEPLAGARALDRPLETFVADLARDGYHAFALEAKLEPGQRKQNGLTVLALRRCLQSVHRAGVGLRGVILVGRFPAASIVRQNYWEKDGDLVLNAGTDNEKKFAGVHWLVSRPEPVSSVADIVLADLDGDWEKVYQRNERKLPFVVAVYPDKDITQATEDWETGTDTFRDYFLVQDGAFRIEREGKALRVSRVGPVDNECTADDRRLPNPLARPEIAVSRLDASMVALRPNPRLRSSDGHPAIDSNGRPLEAQFEEGKVPSFARQWVRDPYLERELLYAYFERNHRYRTQGAGDAARAGCYSTEWGSSVPEIMAAVPGWDKKQHDDLVGTHLTVNDWVKWMQRPALFRAIKAHSSPWGSDYGKSSDSEELLREVGGISWAWEQKGNRLLPASFSSGTGGFALYYTMYRNRVLPDTPNMFLYTGCEGITPAEYDVLPYGHEDYGKFQGAQALMMYCNGLVLIGRGKVFNDEPAELAKVLGEGGTWGDAWMHYFSVDGANPEENRDNTTRIRRKKAYFWALLGDWTLRLQP